MTEAVRLSWFERQRQRLRDFWRRLSEGLTLQELWTQFRKETTAGYRSYAKGVQTDDQEEKPARRAGRVVQDLFWATLSKLSPVRRLLLLVALVLWLLPLVGLPLFFAVADVAGKSVPAALLAATLQASLRTAAYEAASLPDLVARINSYACDHSLDGRRFTTGVFAELEPASGSLAYVNAGHNPPILLRRTGEMATLDAGGLPLGIDRDRGYECRSVVMQPGDLLVLYTDGVVEAENEKREEYGEDRLRALLQSSGAAEASQVLENILKSVETFLGVAPQGDDITCFVLRYRSKP